MRLTNVPDVARNPGGVSLANQLERDEKFIGVLSFNGDRANTYVTLATAQGKIKRTTLEEFANIQAGGTRAINLAEGEQLGWAYLTQGGGEFLITTAQGQALRFAEDDVPVQGRVAAGVWAIKLAEGDRVISLDMIQPDGWLVVASARGFAKRVALKEFPTKGRYTGGVTVFTPDNKMGELAAARITSLADDVIFISSTGLNVRVRAENLAKGNRSAKAKPFVALKDTDNVTRLTSLGGQSEGAEAESTLAKKADKVAKGAVAAPSNGHGSANGSEKMAEAKVILPSKKKATADKAKAQDKPARARAAAARKQKAAPPAAKSRASAKKDKPAPAQPKPRKQAVEADADQMELPIASFKPLPKKGTRGR
jgi:hypothetical protein